MPSTALLTTLDTHRRGLAEGGVGDGLRPLLGVWGHPPRLLAQKLNALMQFQNLCVHRSLVPITAA